ncbi:MAG: prephenate dehydratase [Arenicellales bacterium]
MSQENELKQLRDQIDGVDSELLALIQKRISLAQAVGKVKEAYSQQDAVIYRPEREAQVVRRMVAESEGAMNAHQINTLYREIMSICRGAEARLRVAVLGPEGTFTEMAALQQFGSSVDISLQARIDQIFSAVETGETHYGVVPVENSTEGVISETADLLANTSLNIAGEIYLPIHHALLSKLGNAKEIKVIYSHAQSLSQCRLWLQENIPDVQIKSVASNAEAAKMARDCEQCAAIAGEHAAEQYGLNVLSSHIEDHKHNTTRFLVLSQEQIAASGKDKTSLLMGCKNEPGSLFKLLAPFQAHEISLLKIESRPSKVKRWEYLFFVDIEGHHHDAAIAPALAEVADAADYFRVLGAYPRAD